MRNAKKLLEAMTARYAPPKGAKHALLVHEGRLNLVAAQPDGEFLHVVFEDEDLERSVESIMEDVVYLLEPAATAPSGICTYCNVPRSQCDPNSCREH